MKTSLPANVEALLGRYPAETRLLARAARRLVLTSLRGVGETVDASAGVIGYGYGTGYKGGVCTLILGKAGLKIGLVYGASLADPDGLLSGSGKVHRFVPIRTATDLETPGLVRLLEAAHEAARARLE